MTSTACAVAVLGAGPYGLAATAHLRDAGIDSRIFGRPMEFWRNNMPAGMLLRSSWEASHISDPGRRLTLDRYQSEQGFHLPSPLPLHDFVGYGKWFGHQVAPDVDRRTVVSVEPHSNGFRLTMDDGESILSRRVVIAAGIADFAWRPPQFAHLPSSLVSHTSEHRSMEPFAGRSVTVVGGGQSAVESAALLCEAGATVELLVRAPRVTWLGRGARLRRLPKPVRYLFFPPTDVGPPGLNLLVAMPDLFRRLPRSLQDRIAYRSIRPAAAGWLLPRIKDVTITTGRAVVKAVPVREKAHLLLNDGTERLTDHVLLATGYRLDISRYSFLSQELVRSLRCVDGYPVLKPGLESSMPGLHFLGAPAAWSYGPLMRFVSGTDYAARSLVRHILDRAPGQKPGEDRP
ncbi:MAG: NAD(P)-binding domain-containing protein [Sphingomonadaceae bacterium]